MDILHTAWQKVKSGEGRVVDVVGEEGVGKSRLIYEFQKTIAKEATILPGVCIQYGRSINFLPIIDVVKAAFEIKEGMHPIVPIMLGDAMLSQKMAARLLEKGVYVIGFFYPVVPKGTARIRVQISAGHSQDDLDFAVEKFSEVKKEMGI